MDKIGRYRITEQIGAGVFGDIFLANDVKIGRNVVIKTLRFDRFQKKEEAEAQKKRFLKEVKLAGKLIHPNIVTIYDVGKTEKGFFITMEYVEGKTLENLFEEDVDLSLQEILGIVHQVAQALDFAHSHDVIHSDISPTNIVKTDQGRIKVMDFGIAHYSSAEHVTRAGLTVGTPGYISPEQILGRPPDSRSDIFSLGTVFYQLVFGVKPFDGKSVSSIFHQVLHEEPEMSGDLVKPLPHQIVKIFNHSLKKKPEERYQTVSEMIKDLENAKNVVILMQEKTTITDPRTSQTLKPRKINKTRKRVTSSSTSHTPSKPKSEKQHATKVAQSKPLKITSTSEKKVVRPDEISKDKANTSIKVTLNKPVLAHESGRRPGQIGRHRQGYALLLTGFVLVSLFFIITVIYLFWGDAIFFMKFLHFQSESQKAGVFLEDIPPESSPFDNASDENKKTSVITIDSQPPDADVYIQHRLVGQTPLDNITIPAGQFLIEVRKSGYSSWTEEVTVVENEPRKLDILLEGIEQLIVTSYPSGAEVYIDNELKGRTPIEFEDLTAGNYEISIELNGYKKHLEKVILSKDQKQKTINVELVKEQLGALRVISEPGVAVSLNGENKGSAPLLLRDIPIGSYTVTLKISDQNPYSTTASVASNKTTSITHYFYKPGALRINAIPFGTAYLDGDKKGITPLLISDVPHGLHEVKIVKPGYKTGRQTIMIKEGKEETVFITLEKL